MIHLLSNIIYDGCTHARPQRKLALQKNSKATTLDDLKCAALQFLGAPLQMFARHSYDTLPKRQNSWNTVIPNTGDRSQVMPISAQPVEWMWQLALKCKHHPERTINKLQGGWAHHQLETLTRRPASDKTYINGWRVVRAHGDGPVRQASGLHQHGERRTNGRSACMLSHGRPRLTAASSGKDTKTRSLKGLCSVRLLLLSTSLPTPHFAKALTKSVPYKNKLEKGWN